ncbi:MAG: hypothetical protein JWM82_3307 [Myxococcales bacterium]|nr:hypothetical protein [Myxococcales bacterium]
MEEGGGAPFRLDAEGLRASLSAVREAQEAALARNRRETWKARALVGTAVATFVVGLAFMKTRPAHDLASRRPATSTAVVAAAPLASALAASPVATQASPVAMEAAVIATASPVAAETDISASAGAVGQCVALSARHHWREAAEPCAVAVAAQPNDANMILRLAQAEHARNHLPEAGSLAKRALALDANLPEAFVIEAHAEARAGNATGAARSFRRYLALAPHGWHAREARDALRGARD